MAANDGGEPSALSWTAIVALIFIGFILLGGVHGLNLILLSTSRVLSLKGDSLSCVSLLNSLVDSLASSCAGNNNTLFVVFTVGSGLLLLLASYY